VRGQEGTSARASERESERSSVALHVRRSRRCVCARVRVRVCVCVCVYCVIIILNMYTDPDDLSTLVLVEWHHCDPQGSQQVSVVLLGFS
jgi:hypothetical protein